MRTASSCIQIVQEVKRNFFSRTTSWESSTSQQNCLWHAVVLIYLRELEKWGVPVHSTNTPATYNCNPSADVPRGLGHDTLLAFDITTLYCYVTLCMYTSCQHDCLIVSHPLQRRGNILAWKNHNALKQRSKSVLWMFVFHETSMQGHFPCFFIATLAGNVGLPGVRLQASGWEQRGEQFTICVPFPPCFAICVWVCLKTSSN